MRAVRLLRGLPRGVSSLVECSVVWADVAGVRGYTVVSMVRLGMINCTYLLWLAYRAKVWCGDSETSSADVWKILQLRCVGTQHVAPPELPLNFAPLWDQLFCMSQEVLTLTKSRLCGKTKYRYQILNCACQQKFWEIFETTTLIMKTAMRRL